MVAATPPTCCTTTWHPGLGGLPSTRQRGLGGMAARSGLGGLAGAVGRDWTMDTAQLRRRFRARDRFPNSPP